MVAVPAELQVAAVELTVGILGIVSCDAILNEALCAEVQFAFPAVTV